jgi:hypothetical protein
VVEQKKKTTKTFSFKKPLGNELLLTSESLIFHESLKLYILDLKIENIKKNKIDIKNLTFKTLSENKPYGESNVVFEQKEDLFKADARLLIKLPTKKAFTLFLKYQDIEMKQIIEEKYL